MIHTFPVSPQIITDGDYLPLLLGRSFCQWIPCCRGYNESVEPRISGVFALAFRFAHASVPPAVDRLNQSCKPLSPKIQLRSPAFAVWSIVKEGKEFLAPLQCKVISFRFSTLSG